MDAGGCCWSRVADAWEAHAGEIEKTHGDATRVLVEAAAIRPGDRVLELGAGTGHLAVRLADLVGPEGVLVASDVAPEMVALIRPKLDHLPQCSATVVDAASIPDADEAYDVVVSRMGLMFVPDPSQALQEIWRVLRPGGRLATAVWADAAKNPWMTSVAFAAVVNGVLTGSNPAQPGGPFSLGDPEQLEKLAGEAGFVDVRVETVEWRRHYGSAEEHVDLVRVLAPPIAAALATATDEQLAAVRASAEELTAAHRLDDGTYDLPACALVLTASRPRA